MRLFIIAAWQKETAVPKKKCQQLNSSSCLKVPEHIWWQWIIIKYTWKVIEIQTGKKKLLFVSAVSVFYFCFKCRASKVLFRCPFEQGKAKCVLWFALIPVLWSWYSVQTISSASWINTLLSASIQRRNLPPRKQLAHQTGRAFYRSCRGLFPGQMFIYIRSFQIVQSWFS